jgi:hypothetical protein
VSKSTIASGHNGKRYRSFSTRVSQLKIWHFELLVKKETLADALSTGCVITQFAKLAAGEQLCRLCTYREL